MSIMDLIDFSIFGSPKSLQMELRRLFAPSYTSISTTASTVTHVALLTAASLWTMSLPSENAAMFHGANKAQPLTIQASWLPTPPKQQPLKVQIEPLVDDSKLLPVATSGPKARQALVNRQRTDRAVSDQGKTPVVTQLTVPGERNVRRADSEDLAKRPSQEVRIRKRVATFRPPQVKVAPPQRIGVDKVTPPNYSVTRAPKYPPQAQALGHEGEVVLRLFVSAKGVVEKAEVVKSSGYAELDQAAIDAVTTWRGRPAMQDGRAVSTTEKLRIQFRIPR